MLIAPAVCPAARPTETAPVVPWATPLTAPSVIGPFEALLAPRLTTYDPVLDAVRRELMFVAP